MLRVTRFTCLLNYEVRSLEGRVLTERAVAPSARS